MPQSVAATTVHQAHRQTALIVSCLIASWFIFLLLVEGKRRGFLSVGGAEATAANPILVYALYAAAVMNVVLGRVLRTLLLRRPPQTIDEGVTRLRNVSIVTAALHESIVLFGLLLVLLAQRYPDFYVLFAIALLLQAMTFPRLAEWERWLQGPGNERMGQGGVITE
ncbi:MAG: hypothetical protein HY696_10595 [Deltaproteobacteria bacterium]|nr:hypothetical protein [Deltaproteobacteria bacterium]